MARATVVRAVEALGMAMIGDGVFGLIQPERHLARWESGPEWWQYALKPIVEKAADRRTIAALEVIAGVALVWVLKPPRN